MNIATALFPILFVYDPNYMTTLISFIPGQFIFLSWFCLILFAMSEIFFTFSFWLRYDSSTVYQISSNDFICDL